MAVILPRLGQQNLLLARTLFQLVDGCLKIVKRLRLSSYDYQVRKQSPTCDCGAIPCCLCPILSSTGEEKLRKIYM